MCERLPTRIRHKAGTTGKLFGSVTASDVVAAVEKQFHVVIDRKHVDIPTPIRDVGTHKVTVMLYADVRGTLTVEVRSA
jgi:large subunit ribosomal protein L9